MAVDGMIQPSPSANIIVFTLPVYPSSPHLCRNSTCHKTAYYGRKFVTYG